MGTTEVIFSGFSSGYADRVNTILIPTDFSPAAQRVTDSGLSFLRRQGPCRVILLNAYTLPDGGSGQLVTLHDELKKYSLQRLLTELGRIQNSHATDGISFETQSFLGAPENVLSYVVREGGVDCVILGLGPDRKTSEETLRILQRLTCPALVMPGTAP